MRERRCLSSKRRCGGGTPKRPRAVAPLMLGCAAGCPVRHLGLDPKQSCVRQRGCDDARGAQRCGRGVPAARSRQRGPRTEASEASREGIAADEIESKGEEATEDGGREVPRAPCLRLHAFRSPGTCHGGQQRLGTSSMDATPLLSIASATGMRETAGCVGNELCTLWGRTRSANDHAPVVLSPCKR